MWFIIIIFILLVLFGLFKPKLHGYVGELAVRYRLSKLDPAKYALIVSASPNCPVDVKRACQEVTE